MTAETMNTPANRTQVIDVAVKYLASRQLPSGEFASYRFKEPYVESEREFDSSPFPSALIAYCLHFSRSPEAKLMVGKVAHFLASEMENGGVWRYWTAQHKFHRNIPPDLDDIACASTILQIAGINFPDNRKLLLANRSPKGLFYTWIVPRVAVPQSFANFKVALQEAFNFVALFYFWKLTESEPDDVDGVVNANILYYLGESAATQSAITYLINIVIEGKEETCDKWHLSRFNLYYALSRNIFAKLNGFKSIREIIIERTLLAANSDGTIGAHLLDTALAVCTLINLGVSAPELDRAVEAIVITQAESGAWPILPLYYGGPKKYYGWGSEELTTAFCLEALVRYEQA
jgi:hypothetical protein